MDFMAGDHVALDGLRCQSGDDAMAELLVPMRSMAATTAREAGDGFC
jgi:hypothetical protein